MKPHQVARRLHLIADGIDSSSEPSQSIAVGNIKRLMAALEDLEPDPEAEPEPESEIESDEPTILSPQTEYSLQLDLSLTADFEGNVDRQALTKKFKDEVVAAIKSGMSITARELDLSPVGVRVKPISIECSVTEPEPE